MGERERDGKDRKMHVLIVKKLIDHMRSDRWYNIFVSGTLQWLRGSAYVPFWCFSSRMRTMPNSYTSGKVSTRIFCLRCAAIQ